MSKKSSKQGLAKNITTYKRGNNEKQKNSINNK